MMVDSAEDQKIHRPMAPREVRELGLLGVWSGWDYLLVSATHCLTI